jgi:hypothetical protein
MPHVEGCLSPPALRRAEAGGPGRAEPAASPTLRRRRKGRCGSERRGEGIMSSFLALLLAATSTPQAPPPSPPPPEPTTAAPQPATARLAAGGRRRSLHPSSSPARVVRRVSAAPAPAKSAEAGVRQEIERPTTVQTDYPTATRASRRRQRELSAAVFSIRHPGLNRDP